LQQIFFKKKRTGEFHWYAEPVTKFRQRKVRRSLCTLLAALSLPTCSPPRMKVLGNNRNSSNQVGETGALAYPRSSSGGFQALSSFQFLLPMTTLAEEFWFLFPSPLVLTPFKTAHLTLLTPTKKGSLNTSCLFFGEKNNSRKQILSQERGCFYFFSMKSILPDS
jgi:hypothetical protein